MATNGQQPDYAEWDRQKRLVRPHKALAVSTAGDKTYTAAELLMYPTIKRDANGAARTDTFPAASTIIALLNRRETGVSFEVDFINWNTALTSSNAHTVTLAAGSGFTFIGSPVIPAGASARLRFEVSGATTMNVYILNHATSYSSSATVSTVAQATNITTGVTLNAYQGLITTQSASTAAAAEDSFTLTNSHIGANSMVFVTISSYSGTHTTNGVPVVAVTQQAAGSCIITITNLHAANALSGTFTIGFKVENPV